MEMIVIEGGKRLEGEIPIAGAKNAALPAIVASLLVAGTTNYSNVPDLMDTRTICKLLREFGVKITDDKKNCLSIDATNITDAEAPYELVRTMRASCLVLGPLLARNGHARLSLPGGCAIGERPINLHLMGFEALGAEISLEHGYITATAKNGLKGARIVFDTVTVTGTENLMMAATAATGETVLENVAKEPEIVFFAEMLRSMGVKIEGEGTHRIVIHGGKPLHAADIKIIPDRIETGTFMAAAAITGGHLLLTGADPSGLEAVINKFIATGCKVEEKQNSIEIWGPERLQPVDIDTQPHPGFPTDMQAQLMAMMALADGTSTITENIFENRFMHVAELRRMGADVKVKEKSAVVKGLPQLSGASVMATDLRASASLIVAGLAAEGKTYVRRIYHLDRGYEKIEEKLNHVGAIIKREKDKG